MNIIGRKYIFLSVSGALVVLGLVAVLWFGLKPGIEFGGGSLWQLRFEDQSVTKDRLAEFFGTSLALPDIVVTPGAERGEFLVRSREIPETSHVAYRARLISDFGNFEELRFETIGAAVGGELRTKAVIAFFFVLLTISLYIAFVFRKVSRPVASWKYGIITLVTLFHDAMIPIGLFAFLGHYAGAEVDINFIVAILVVIGFSVHDTIVVFDRIRENVRLAKNPHQEFDRVVNDSVNQTIGRSVNTSLTLVLVLVALYILGSSTLRAFVLTILVGVVAGTYSSIFVASPLLTLWRKRTTL